MVFEVPYLPKVETGTLEDNPMPDKYDTDIQKQVEAIQAELDRINASCEKILRDLNYVIPPPTPRNPSPTPRDAATNGPFRSGRWPIQDGTFPAGASGITPGPTNADRQTGNLRSPKLR